MSVSNQSLEKPYPLWEEIVHSITHGVGAVLSIVGLVFLIVQAVAHGTTWHIVSYSVYGASLIILYLASSIYHGVQHPRIKPILQKVDHAAVYILIAGTYTPFLLTNLRGPWGWSLFGVIWGLAAIGLLSKLSIFPTSKKALVPLYAGMGWLMVVAIRQLYLSFSPATINLIIIGGVFYTVGIVFYLWKKLPYHHIIWHLLVLAGSIAHFYAVYFIL